MKSVLLALAVILACAVYEVDRESRIAWHPEVRQALDIRVPEDRPLTWNGDGAGPADLLATPDDIASRPGMPAGRVELNGSTRLFGPGVSRKQQVRI